MSKSSRKSSKIKVPKRLAGVKIPKSVRKGPVLQFMNSPAGKLLIAEALTAALALFAYKGIQNGGGKELKLTALQAEESLKRNTARLTHAFGEAVRAFREALSEADAQAPVGEARADQDSAAMPEDAVEPPVAKKNIRRTSGNLSQL